MTAPSRTPPSPAVVVVLDEHRRRHARVQRPRSARSEAPPTSAPCGVVRRLETPPVRVEGRTVDRVEAALHTLTRMRPLVCSCGAIEGGDLALGAAIVHRGGDAYLAVRCRRCDPRAEILTAGRARTYAGPVRALPSQHAAGPLREGER